jgi:large subunit ribosomal protein L9
MKVILTENIEKVGVKGDVINVKRGFARNYLVPRNFAIYATPQNMKNLAGIKQKYADEESKRLEQLKLIGEKITGLKLVYVRKVDEHENLYGSVSEMDILHELKEKNIDIPKAAVLMDKHIKQLGDFEVTIRLHKDINVTVHGTVEKEGADKDSIEKEVPKKEKVKAVVVDEPVVEEEAAVEELVAEVPAVEEVAVEETIEETVVEPDVEEAIIEEIEVPVEEEAAAEEETK